MKIQVKTKIGKSVVEIETDERSPMLALSVAGAFTAPMVCGRCGSEDISLSSNKGAPEGKGEMLFVKRQCNKCGATSSLGEFQGTGGFYWKAWEEDYRKRVQATSQKIANNQPTPSAPQKPEQQQPVEDPVSNDLPF